MPDRDSAPAAAWRRPRGSSGDAARSRSRGTGRAPGDRAGGDGFLGQGQQRLELAGEGQAAASGVVAIDQRLLAHPVAGQDERAAGRVPDRQGEHPAQQAEHPRPLVLVEVDEDLGVALRAERMPLGLQPTAQRGEVVDLAVEDRPDGAVLVRERLMPAGQVDDRQPAEAQRGVVVAIGPGVVRPAVDEPVRHRLERASGIAPAGSDHTAPQMPHMPPSPSADEACHCDERTSTPRRGGAVVTAILACRPGPAAIDPRGSSARVRWTRRGRIGWNSRMADGPAGPPIPADQPGVANLRTFTPSRTR